MSRPIKILCCAVLSFCTLFSAVGYATISGTMTVSGSASATPPEGIYIVDVAEEATSNATSESVEHIPFSTNVISTVQRTANNSSVSYSVTIWNNTPYIYAYGGVEYLNDRETTSQYNGNSYLTTSGSRWNNQEIIVTTSLPTSTIINPNERVTFTTTYTLENGLTRNYDYKTLVNYKFAVNVDSVGEVAVDEVLIQLDDILNDVSEGGAYETLIDAIDDKYDGVNDWTSNYIGNVGDANSTDVQTINSLFEGKLNITVDGETQEITLIIKRENIDGDESTGDSFTATKNNGSVTMRGCEMTIYVTTDALNSRGYAPVYAAVYTCDQNDDGTPGTWYMLGDRYAGEANVVGYNGEVSTGSFDTGTWRSTAQTYRVTDSYSYSVARSSSPNVSALTVATDANANSTFLSLLNRAKAIIDDNEVAGTAMVSLKEKYAAAARYYTVDASGNITLVSGVTRAQLVPHIKALDVALQAFD